MTCSAAPPRPRPWATPREGRVAPPAAMPQHPTPQSPPPLTDTTPTPTGQHRSPTATAPTSQPNPQPDARHHRTQHDRPTRSTGRANPISPPQSANRPRRPRCPVTAAPTNPRAGDDTTAGEHRRQHRDRIAHRFGHRHQPRRCSERVQHRTGDLGQVVARMPVTRQPAHFRHEDRIRDTSHLIPPAE